MNKIKILYDITPISESRTCDSNRTGIFFCAYNILKELTQNNEVILGLYCESRALAYAKDSIREITDKDFQVINENTQLIKLSRLWFKLEEQRNKFKKNNKQIKNYFMRILEIAVEIGMHFLDSNNDKNVAQYDFFFSVSKQAPNFILKDKKMRKGIILHDTIGFLFPEYFPGMSKWYRTHWIKRLVNTMSNEEIFFANSERTKEDFLKLRTDIISERISVVYHACGEHFIPCKDDKIIKEIKAKYKIESEKKYIFSLCTIEPRKNLIRIIRSFIKFVVQNEIEDMVLILGGSEWNSFIKQFETSVGSMNDFEKYVKRIGYVKDEDLPVLYSGAEWFVYTSQYEGFGVPPLEAMSCGCPVIVSNNSSLPEVVGDAGILIDWDSDEQHIEAYKLLYYDSILRKRMAQKGFERSKIFSWKNAVDEIVTIIKNEIGKCE